MPAILEASAILKILPLENLFLIPVTPAALISFRSRKLMLKNSAHYHLRYRWLDGFIDAGQNVSHHVLPGFSEMVWLCSENLGEGFVSVVNFGSELSLFIIDCQFKQDLLFSSEDTPSVVVFKFYLSGQGEYYFSDGQEDRHFSLRDEAQQSFYSFRQPSSQSYLKAGTRLLEVSVVMPLERLLTYLESSLVMLSPRVRIMVKQSKGNLHPFTMAMTSEVKAAVQQVLNCRFKGLCRKLFMKGRALELISLQLSQLDSSSPPLEDELDLRMSPDQDRIVFARDMLIRDLENPPSLSELAKATGMSHPKLNRCFREKFGVTVFQYLKSARLDLARKILTRQKVSVSEAAFAVGYNDISHFSQLYKKHFGVSPSSYARSS